MGLGSEEKRRAIYYLSPRSKDKDSSKPRPHFKVTKVDENRVKTELPDETEVSGFLAAITHGEYEYDNKKVKTIAIWLLDGERLFKVEANINSNMIRSLMNSILGVITIDHLKISLYVNKEGYANIYVTNNGEPCRFKFDYKEVIAPMIQYAPDPQDPEKQMKVYHNINKMLLEEWEKAEPLVLDYAKKQERHLAPPPAKTSTAPAAAPVTNDESAPPPDDLMPLPDNDLPF